MPKAVHLAEGQIIDFGDIAIGSCYSPEGDKATLIYIPEDVPLEITGAMYSTCACGGVEYYTTHKGRKAVRVLPGSTHSIHLRKGSGDVTWDGWVGRYSSDSYAIAAPANTFGSAWWELVVREG